MKLFCLFALILVAGCVAPEQTSKQARPTELEAKKASLQKRLDDLRIEYVAGKPDMPMEMGV